MITRKFCGLSGSKGAILDPKYTVSLSAPQDLGGTYNLVTGKYGLVREVSGFGYATMEVRSGNVLSLVTLPNGRKSTFTVPARMTGPRCLVPFLEASDSAQGFTRMAGQIIFTNRMGSGDLDWVHLPKVINQQVTEPLKKAFLAKSSLTVESYTPPKVAQAGIFGANDKRASLKVFAQLAKSLSVKPVQASGVQALAESTANGASLTIDTSSGVFRGAFTETRGKTKVPRTVSGVILQTSRQGKGMTSSDAEILPVSIEPSL